MDFVTTLLANVADPTVVLRVLFSTLAVKVGFSVLTALRNRTFTWHRLPEFLEDDVVWYGGGLAVVWFASLLDPALNVAFTASATAVEAMFVKQSASAIANFFKPKEG